MKKLYIALTIATLIGCGEKTDQPKQVNSQPKQTNSAVTPEPEPLLDEAEAEPEPLPIEIMLQKKSLSDAITFAKIFIEDKFNTDDLGTLMLLAWSSNYLKWSDVDHKDQTSIPLVRKDPHEARGKHYCASGRIIQIETLPKNKHFNKSYNGLLIDNSRNLVRFYAARSSGSLVEKNPARICGIVTGVYDYKNSGGGTGHAVKLVGMFDLPENRKQHP